MGDEIENGGKLQKEHFCLVKKMGGILFGLIRLCQKNWRVDPADSKKSEGRSGLFKKIGGHICHFVLLNQ